MVRTSTGAFLIASLLTLPVPDAEGAQGGAARRGGAGEAIQVSMITAPTLLNRVLTRQAAPANCGRPAPADYFTADDTRMLLWLEVDGVRPGDEWRVIWTSPGDRSEQYTDRIGFAGYNCLWVSWNPQGYGGGRFGDWEVSVQIRGVNVGRFTTVLIGPNQPFIDRISVEGNSRLTRVSPNGWAVIRGSRLATQSFPSYTDTLPTSAAGVMVTVNDAPAALRYANGSEVYFQIPPWVRGDSVLIRAHTNAGGSNFVRVPLTTASPAFVHDASGLVVHRRGTDGSTGWVDRSFPLRRGDVATVQATGLGHVRQPPRDGQVRVAVTQTGSTPTVTLGGVRVEVRAAVMADFPGLYWVSFEVPDEVPNGDFVPIDLGIDGIPAITSSVPIAGPPPSFPDIAVRAVAHPSWNGPDRDDRVYSPTSLVHITASHLRAKAPTYIRCFGANGYQAKTPAVDVSADSATAIVPPYYDPRFGAYLSGSVTCELVQRVAGRENVSNTFSMHIEAPPVLRNPPGTATLALLQAAAQSARHAEALMTLKDRSLSDRSAYSTVNARAEMDEIVGSFAPHIDAVRRIASGAVAAVQLGTNAVGQPVVITRDQLAQTDRWIMMVMGQVYASAANAEEEARSARDTRVRTSGALYSFGRALTACHMPVLGEWLFDVPAQRQERVCAAVDEATGSLPAAGGAALFEAGQQVGQFVERFATVATTVGIPGVPPTQLAAALARISKVVAGTQIVTGAIAHLALKTSPYSQEDRSMVFRHFIDAAKSKIRSQANGALDNFLDMATEGAFGDDFRNNANTIEKWRRLPHKVEAVLHELRAAPAETTQPVVERNSDGSYVARDDPGFGPVNLITGRVLLQSGYSVPDGQVDISDGDRLSAPFATAPTRLDGTFRALVPRLQVGRTIPDRTSVSYRVPRVGADLSYQTFTTGPIHVGQPGINLPTVSINPGQGGGGGRECGADWTACPAD
jgi:uncharacterized protein (TIGR03437 family)